MLQRRRLLQASALLCPFTGTALAQDAWPSRPLTYVVPLAVGGATDILGRLISQRLAQKLGTTVVVENKTGAGGSIGTEFVARAPADGYTLLGGTISTHAINVSMYKNLGYDPIESFVPLAMIGLNPLLLVVPPNSPYRTVQEMFAAAAKSPGKLTFASAGNGTSMHMAMELLAYRAGLKLVHVPYKGSAPALQDVLGGQVDMVFDTAVVVAPYVKAGRVRALATGMKQRLDAFPEVPTIVESGIKDFEVYSWHAVFARRGIPAAAETRLRTEITDILRAPEVRDRMVQLGTMPVEMSPAEMNKFLTTEIEKWRQVINASAVKV